MVSDAVLIRPAALTDAKAIADIYNEAILTTTATFDTEPKSVEDRREWLLAHGEKYPVLVAAADGEVVGWASLTQYSDRRAYDPTAETSAYVKDGYRGRGIGRRLKEVIIDEARRLGYHSLIARIAEGSDASLHLNEVMGFERVGTLKEVGRKFGQLLDVHFLQLMLQENPPEPR